MAFVMTSNPQYSQRLGVDQDDMEISSDAGHQDEIDIDIQLDGNDVHDSPDAPMEDDYTADAQDLDMRDDLGDDAFKEEDMEDLIDDGDEEIHDVDDNPVAPNNDITLHGPTDSIQSPEYDLLHESAPHLRHDAEQSDAHLDVITPALGEGNRSTDGEAPPLHLEAPPPDPALKAEDKTHELSVLPSADVGEEDAKPSHEHKFLDSVGTDDFAEQEHILEPAEESGNTAAHVESEISSQARPAEIHPIIIVWDGSEISLFPNEEPYSQFLIQDTAYEQSSLTDLFKECRKVLKDHTDETVELVFDVPQLDLTIHEELVINSTCSISDIVDIYLNLSLNDGIEQPEPMRVILASRPTFSSRINELRDAATSGQGLPRTITYDSDEVDGEEEDDGENKQLEHDGGGYEDAQTDLPGADDQPPPTVPPSVEQVADVETQSKVPDLAESTTESTLHRLNEKKKVEKVESNFQQDSMPGTGAANVEEAIAKQGQTDQSEAGSLNHASRSSSSEPKAAGEGFLRNQTSETRTLEDDEKLETDKENPTSASKDEDDYAHETSAEHEQIERLPTHKGGDTTWNEADDARYEIDYSEDENDQDTSNDLKLGTNDFTNEPDATNDHQDERDHAETESFAEGPSEYIDAEELLENDDHDYSLDLPPAEDDIEDLEDSAQFQTPKTQPESLDLSAVEIGKTLSRKRSFSEHEAGDEAESNSDSKKARP